MFRNCLLVGLYIVGSNATTFSNFHVWDDLINGSLSSLGTLQHDDPRFTMQFTYDETELPKTPVFMNAVDILAQYAEMDYLSRTPGRHGRVLDSYPQVEIAVLPAEPATSVEVRLVIWAVYGTIVENVSENTFNQSDTAFFWDGRQVGNVYITRPLDEASRISNLTNNLMLNEVENSTNLDANIGGFGWYPVYKPGALLLAPHVVFIMVMATIKLIAENPMNAKIDGAFHVGNVFANAHVEVYLEGRRIPRPRPPYFQYAHLLEAMRRAPGWMLQNRRFAEMYCSISSAGLPVGQLLLLLGQFVSPLFDGARGNLSIS